MKVLVGSLVSFGLLVSICIATPVQAKGLTTDQIQAILYFLYAFNIEQGALDNVQASLTGDSCYTVNSSGVYWPYPSVNGSRAENNTTRIDADAATFVALTSSQTAFPYNCFGKDANDVFYNSGKIVGADAQSFEVLARTAGKTRTSAISKDAHSVYFGDRTLQSLTTADNSAHSVILDPKTFFVLDQNYIKADGVLYYIGDIGNGRMNEVKNADVASFSPARGVSSYDAQDINYKYLQGQVAQ